MDTERNVKTAPVRNVTVSLTRPLATSDKVSDKLFSRTSLRCITAANIRENERLFQVFRSIDCAAKTYHGDFDYQRKAMHRRHSWLQSKLTDRSWRRILKPKPGESRGHATFQEDPLTELLFPGLDPEHSPEEARRAQEDFVPTLGNAWTPSFRMSRQSTGFGTQCSPFTNARTPDLRGETCAQDECAASGHHRGANLSLEDVQRLVIQIHRANTDIPDSAPITEAERRLLDLISKAVNLVERNSAGRAGARGNPSRGNDDILRRLSIALGADVASIPAPTPTPISRANTGDKRQKFFHQMKVTPTLLPPISALKPAKLYARDWDIGEKTSPAPQISDSEWDELHYCRYLRGPKKESRVTVAP